MVAFYRIGEPIQADKGQSLESLKQKVFETIRTMKIELPPPIFDGKYVYELSKEERENLAAAEGVSGELEKEQEMAGHEEIDLDGNNHQALEDLKDEQEEKNTVK